MPFNQPETRADVEIAAKNIYRVAYSDGFTAGLLTGSLLTLVTVAVVSIVLGDNQSNKGSLIRL